MGSHIEAEVALAGMAGRQHGVVTWQQLRDSGFSAGAIRHRIAVGRWTPVLPRVTAVTSGTLTRAATLEAALLYGGPQAVLSHRSAAEEWGLLPAADPPGPVHITVPYTCSAVARQADAAHPGVVVHRSRALEAVRDRNPALRRTSWPATVVGVAAGAPSAAAAARVLVDLLSHACRDDVGRVRRQLAHRPPPRYLATLVATLELLDCGVRSMLEYRYAVHVEQPHGLLPGRRQLCFVVDGRTRYEDVCYDERHGAALTVRLDCRARNSRAAHPQRNGEPRITIGWDDTVGNPCGVFALVLHLLQRRGATVRWHPCPNCPPAIRATAHPE